MTEDVERLHDELYWTPMLLAEGMQELDFFYVGDMESQTICSTFYVDKTRWICLPNDAMRPVKCNRECESCGKAHLLFPKVTRAEEMMEPISFTAECTIAFNKATSGIPHVLPMIMRAEACWLSYQSLEDLALGDYTRMVNEAIASYWQIREKPDFGDAVKRFEGWMSVGESKRAELQRFQPNWRV